MFQLFPEEQTFPRIWKRYCLSVPQVYAGILGFYVLTLQYPQNTEIYFKSFSWNIFLEIDGLKLSLKVMSQKKELER